MSIITMETKDVGKTLKLTSDIEFSVMGTGLVDFIQVAAGTAAAINGGAGIDQISFLGGAGDYTVYNSGSTAYFTHTSTGAVTTVVAAGGGDTIAFGDGAPVTFKISAAGVTLGVQTITGIDSPITGASGDAIVDNPVVPTGTRLTTGWDELTGTSADDDFQARVVQNTFGAQTNQLGTGDFIDGGVGNDSLFAKVQMASALNDYPGSAIAPETVDLENAWFTALTAWNGPTTFFTANGQGTTDGLLNRAETVVINAKDMLGLDLVASLQSDASLVIENLTTLTDSGDYGTRRNTEDVTIRMDHSGNDHALDVASDMTVLFDNDYLKSGSTNQSEAQFFLLDQKAEYLNKTGGAGGLRLHEIDVDGIVVTYNGALVPITNPAAWTAQSPIPNGGNGVGFSHDTFVDALQAPLQVLISLGTFPAGTTITTAIVNDPLGRDYIGLDEGVDSDQIPAIILTIGDGTPVTAYGFDRVANTTVDYNVYGDFTQISDPSYQPVTATIELFKVGRGNDGGDLTVGAMCTDLGNWIDYSGDAVKHGIEVFNITVEGDETQFSSLASLQSTNNTLKTVTINWDTGSLADLNIGNDHTNEHSGSGGSSFSNELALKDVRTFTAHNDNSEPVAGGDPITTDVSLWATVTEETVEKYMNRADNAADTSEDNAAFDYSFGAGNDYLNLDLDVTNLEASGTTNREDFSMDVSMGAGNDDVYATLTGGVPLTPVVKTGVTTTVPGSSPTSAPWYINMKIDANLNIETGLGEDTIETPGSSAWIIDAGADNDRVYTDNTGTNVVWTAAVADTLVSAGTAAWVFNTADQTQNVANTPAQTINAPGLISAAAYTAINIAATPVPVNIVNLQLTVNYKGIISTVDVPGTDTTAGARVTDLSINQAIKAAINDNIYLSALLDAEDGPGRTLVVNSLTDGVMNDNDITLSLTRSAATALQTAAGAFMLTDAQATNLGFTFTANAGAQTAAARFDSSLANNGTNDYMGGNSVAANANTVYDGEGCDVIVLSTDNTDTEHVILNADGDVDLIFNASNAHITLLQSNDIIVTPNTSATGSVTFSATSSSVTVVANGTATTITGSGLADTIIVAPGGLGKATINGAAGDDSITGGDGADTINGEAGADTIIGGAGIDTITGGADADTMTGGLGADIFVFATGDNAVTSAATADRITDFTTLSDQLKLGVAGGAAGEFTAVAGASANTYAQALAAANVVFAALNTQSYFMTSYGTDGTSAQGVLFLNMNNDATAEGAILIGVANQVASNVLATALVVPGDIIV